MTLQHHCMTCEMPEAEWPKDGKLFNQRFLYGATTTHGPFCSQTCADAWNQLDGTERVSRAFGPMGVFRGFLADVARGRWKRDQREPVDYLIEGKPVQRPPYITCPHPDRPNMATPSCPSCRFEIVTLQQRITREEDL